MSHILSIKKRAQELRKIGKSYSEILAEIPVAKSTLSLWLREVRLSNKQKQKLTRKKQIGQLKGALKRKTLRISTQQAIYTDSQKEIGKLSARELWLLGIALYWAEGSKEKEYQPGSGVKFSNSDPRMIKIFVRWLLKSCGVKKKDIYFDIYIHATHRSNVLAVQKYWSQITQFPMSNFSNVYFKKHRNRTNRKNTGILYNGLLRVNVRASSELNRKIAGWVMGVVRFYSGK